MLNRITKNIPQSNIEIYKCTITWLLFSIAILRWIELLIPREVVFSLIFPGSVFSLFLVYVLLKLKVFLRFKTYFFSVLLFTISYLIFIFLVNKYLALIPNYELHLYLLVIIAIILAEAFLFYLFALLIKKMAKK